MSTWHQADPDALARLRVELAESFPDLQIVTELDSVTIFGPFDVVADKTLVGTYQIKVVLATDHPRSLPCVYEVEGKIAKSPDRHVNGDGTACLFVVDERWRHWPVGASVTQFLNGPVYYYFLSQSYFELTGKWIFGERSHDVQGVLESYAEELTLTDPSQVAACLGVAASGNIRGHHDCPCGSGKRTRLCHGPKLRSLVENIPRERLAAAWKIAMISQKN